MRPPVLDFKYVCWPTTNSTAYRLLNLAFWHFLRLGGIVLA
jgi:hypothetical protein